MEEQNGNAVNNKDQRLDYLKNRLDMFMNVIDSLDPEATDVEDIDRLISMLDDLEAKYERFKRLGIKPRMPRFLYWHKASV
ncbi:hypothetical protein KQR57_04415 [Bacillus inaquosorum]|nr:hypothetical protein [Bacillus inaquosorum]